MSFCDQTKFYELVNDGGIQALKQEALRTAKKRTGYNPLGPVRTIYNGTVQPCMVPGNFSGNGKKDRAMTMFYPPRIIDYPQSHVHRSGQVHTHTSLTPSREFSLPSFTACTNEHSSSASKHRSMYTIVDSVSRRGGSVPTHPGRHLGPSSLVLGFVCWESARACR